MAKPIKATAKKTAPKKEAVKKAAARKETRTIKYTDKSPGQPQLTPIYNELKVILLSYVKGNLQVEADKAGQLHLHTQKPVEILGRKRDGLFFASLIVQKGYVGFYFMPVYTDVFLKKEIAPELLKTLKGKACFHIKKLDDILKQQIKQAMDAGYACYKSKGWI